MDTRPPSLQTPNLPAPLQQPQAASMSDEIFHLSPFLTLNHHTITAAYYSESLPIQQHHHTPADSDILPSHQSLNHQPPPYNLADDDDPQITSENDEDSDDSSHNVSSKFLRFVTIY